MKKEEKQKNEDPIKDEGKSEASEAATKSEKEAVPNAETEISKEPDWKDLYARMLADFDNYKKRAIRDREDTYRFAEADILKDVLPAVDNLALALDSAKDKGEDPFVKGVKLVYDTLLKSLKDHGAEPFDSIGKELDPEKMEAIHASERGNRRRQGNERSKAGLDAQGAFVKSRASRSFVG